MRNKGVEDNTDGFTTRVDGEGVERYDEEESHGAGEAGGEDGENGPEKTGEDFKRNFGNGVLEEESFDGVGIVVVFTVENLRESVSKKLLGGDRYVTFFLVGVYLFSPKH